MDVLCEKTSCEIFSMHLCAALRSPSTKATGTAARSSPQKYSSAFLSKANRALRDAELTVSAFFLIHTTRFIASVGSCASDVALLYETWGIHLAHHWIVWTSLWCLQKIRNLSHSFVSSQLAKALREIRFTKIGGVRDEDRMCKRIKKLRLVFWDAFQQ